LTCVFQNEIHDTKTCLQIENQEKNINGKTDSNFSDVFQNGIHNITICKPSSTEKKPKKKQSTCGKEIQTNIINNDIEEQYIKRYICECNREYSTRQNLWKHKQKCTERHTKIELSVTKKELNDIKLTLAEVQKTVAKIASNQTPQSIILQPLNTQQEQLQNQPITTNSHNLTTNSHNVVGNNVQNNNQKVINVYQYVNSNYNDAQPIKMLEKQDVDKLLIVDKNIKHSIEDLLIFNQTKYKLDSFLGEIIINAYKKEDPEEQQIWTSNVIKLTFIVRQILNKTDKTWLTDKKGVCLTKHIIEPLLKEIKKLLQKYVKALEEHQELKSLEEIEKSQNKGTFAVKIIYDINDKSLHKKILRYIAPHFQLEQ
jgi:hypothetical protein